MDNGCDFTGWRIHSPRVPQPENAPVIDLDEIVVLHFQYVAWERMIAKHRWYQAWEHLKHQQKGPLEIFREYQPHVRKLGQKRDPSATARMARQVMTALGSIFVPCKVSQSPGGIGKSCKCSGSMDPNASGE